MSYLPANPLYNDANFTHYYKLDANSTDGKGTSNGTDTAISYATAARYGNGATFNGSSSKISVGQLINSNDFSISLWVKNTASGNIFNQGCDFGTCIAIVNGGTLYQIYRYDTTSSKSASTTGVTPSTTTFDHLVYVSNTATSKAKLYVNGVGKIDLGIATALRPYGVGAFLGSLYDGSGQFLNGIIDDVGIWSRALTVAEVLSLYNDGAKPLFFAQY